MKNGDLHFSSQNNRPESFFGRLDPRAKLFIVVVSLVGGFFSDGLWYSAVVSALFMAATVSSGVATSTLRRSLQSIAILATITIAFHILFLPAAVPPDWTVLGFPITAESLTAGLYYALRLVLFALAALFLSLTTAPVDLAEGVVKVCRPLRVLKVPVDDLGLILSLAFRFIPILKEEMTMIRRAQMLRGVTFTGNYFARIKNTVPLLVPVFVSAIDRADTVAMAIEARGYRHNRKRSYFSRHEFGMQESSFVVAVVVVIVVLMLWSR